MTAPLYKLEGTWAEITAKLPDFSDRRLHVMVFLADEQNAEDPIHDVLREIEARSLTMHPAPDDHDYLREARSGAMFGLDPLE